MARKNRREFVMNDKEAADLKKKAKAASMTESQLIRALISGYHPPAAPGKEIHDNVNKLLTAASNLEKALKECKDDETRKKLDEQIAGLELLREALMDKYLLGERKELKWP